MAIFGVSGVDIRGWVWSYEKKAKTGGGNFVDSKYESFFYWNLG